MAARGRMPLDQRAKIFIPFDPLKGFREALDQKELEAAARFGRVGEDVWAPAADDRWDGSDEALSPLVAVGPSAGAMEDNSSNE